MNSTRHTPLGHPRLRFALLACASVAVATASYAADPLTPQQQAWMADCVTREQARNSGTARAVATITCRDQMSSGSAAAANSNGAQPAVRPGVNTSRGSESSTTAPGATPSASTPAAAAGTPATSTPAASTPATPRYVVAGRRDLLAARRKR